MNPNLVCKIVVQTKNGRKRRGTGYPITPNRIITAAHVVDDAAFSEGDTSEGDARQITVSFVTPTYTLEIPVYLEWSGAKQSLDVAVLRCQLPVAYQPTHRLQREAPSTPTKWFAQGYTEFGKDKRPGGKDSYQGELTPFTVEVPTVVLDCNDGPLTETDWKGVSRRMNLFREMRSFLGIRPERRVIPSGACVPRRCLAFSPLNPITWP